MSNPDVSLAEFSGGSYEPWLFQTMIDELASNELGIGFIYLVLEILAKRYALNDAVVVLEHESLTTQEFRLGGSKPPPPPAQPAAAASGKTSAHGAKEDVTASLVTLRWPYLVRLRVHFAARAVVASAARRAAEGAGRGASARSSATPRRWPRPCRPGCRSRRRRSSR